ncbi:hypothetical protein QJS66_08485 [Kocuria rhizophila]|nr:hypothetical protein QJS66_08485 [Kocuria rhizophila]
MSTTLLRVLAQRRPASLLAQESPRPEDLEAVLRAAAGAKYDDRPTGWRVAVTDRRSASLLAAAMARLASVPNLAAGAPVEGQRRSACSRLPGSLQWASRGGVALALIFRHHPRAPGVQEGPAGSGPHTARGAGSRVLRAGWATMWSRREVFDRELIRDFYSLDEHEEVLGWLFVGHAASDWQQLLPARAINLPPRELEIGLDLSRHGRNPRQDQRPVLECTGPP